MTNQKKSTTAGRVTDAALDVAIGGTALVADKAMETLDKVTGRAEEALRRGRREVMERASEASQAARKVVEERDTRPYEERTRDELYDLASDRDIDGRSTMPKDELIAALRAER